MRWIRDSLYGDVIIPGLIEKLIDTEAMQRLRRLNQIPFANLVYPGANHTRFEHSLGVYALTERFCRYADIDRETSKKLMIYALLHDVGHFAFPHVLEDIVKSKTGMGHEEWGQEMIKKGEIRDILQENGINPEEIARIPDEKIGKAITGDLGSDRIDYLLRDSKNTGVAYGAIDADRIMRKQLLINGEIFLDSSAMAAAESMLIGRFMMFANVYNHKTRAAAALMMKKAITLALRSGSITINDITSGDDAGLMYMLLNSGKEEAKIVSDIRNRRLYKRAFEKKLKEFKNWLFLGGIKSDQINLLEKEIADRAGVGEEDIIVFMPKPWFKSPDTKVMYNNKEYKLQELSLILRILNEAQWDYITVYVLTRRELVERVKPVAEKVMKEIEERRF